MRSKFVIYFSHFNKKKVRTKFQQDDFVDIEIATNLPQKTSSTDKTVLIVWFSVQRVFSIKLNTHFCSRNIKTIDLSA